MVRNHGTTCPFRPVRDTIHGIHYFRRHNPHYCSEFRNSLKKVTTTGVIVLKPTIKDVVPSFPLATYLEESCFVQLHECMGAAREFCTNLEIIKWSSASSSYQGCRRNSSRSTCVASRCLDDDEYVTPIEVLLVMHPSTIVASGPPVQLSPRVLSIQSQVVSGYVGNKSAVFPLQLLGLDVDPVHTVQFSNHTGFPVFRGSVMTGDDLWTLVEGLEANELIQYTHLLTGYIGSVSLLKTIVRVAQKLRETNSQLTFVCDPVMGDDGRIYVNPELPGAFKDLIIPIASIMTPNQFEAELLTDLQIRDEGSALRACRALQQKGPHTVVITSCSILGWEDYVTIIASTTLPQQQGCDFQHLRLRVPRVHAYFTGTGDLFTALLLAWMHRYPGNMKAALEMSVAGLQAVLADTVKHAGDAAAAPMRTAKVCKARELRLIQNQQALTHPIVSFTAEPMSASNGTA